MIVVRVEMSGFQYKNYEWCSVVGSPLVVVTHVRNGLVSLKQGTTEIVVSKRDLRGALNALDEQEKIL